MYAIAAYGVQCLAAGCRWSGTWQQGMRHDSCSIPLPGRTPCCLAPDPDSQQPSTAHHRRQQLSYSLELLMMDIEVPETY